MNSGIARHLAKAGAPCGPSGHPTGRQNDARSIDWHCEIVGPNGPGNLIVVVRWNETDQVPGREPHEDHPCFGCGSIVTPVGAIAKKRVAFWECEARTQNAGVARPKRNSFCRPGAIKPERYRLQHTSEEC